MKLLNVRSIKNTIAYLRISRFCASDKTWIYIAVRGEAAHIRKAHNTIEGFTWTPLKRLIL